MRGFFITLEGIDGCGKSTQLDMLAAALEARGFPTVTTRQPGGTPTGQAIRSLMIDEHHRLAPMAELLLMIADRAQHVAEIIKPNLEAGRVVISDRYGDSSVAFQGYGRGLAISTVDELNELATGGLVPDLTLLFDLDIEAARARLDSRANVESEMRGFDEETCDFHLRVRNGYLKLASQYPERFQVLDAAQSVEETHQRVLALVLSRLRTEDGGED
jgi:dTMP kinase